MILLTGSEGFIGREVRKFFDSDDLLRIDITKKDDKDVLNFFDIDITLEEDLAKISSYSIDTIIHNAAIPDINFCAKHPNLCYRTNFVGTLNLLEFARKSSVKNFVYVSSGAVYTPFQNSKDVITEDAPANPRGFYSYTKYLSEQAVKNYSEEFGISATSLRVTAPYGPEITLRDTPAIHTLIFGELITEKKPILMKYGGDHTVNYTFVEDTAEIISLAAGKRLAKYEVFNAAEGNLYTIRKLGEVCKELSPKSTVEIGKGTLVDSKSSEEILKPLRFLQGLRDISKAKNLLNFTPKFDLMRGMKVMIRHKLSGGKAPNNSGDI